MHAQVLLDSEGIEASAQSDQYMAQLFSMCILFSSLFVYNHKGFLEARAFKELSLVATILQEITAGAEPYINAAQGGYHFVCIDNYLLQLEDIRHFLLMLWHVGLTVERYTLLLLFNHS
jgi:hypothetical protein